MATISSGLAAAILFILVIIILVMFAYALYEYQLVTSLEANVSGNPYCVRTICNSDGTQPPINQVPPINDPIRLAYETITYCTVNAPPCELITAVNICAGITDPVTGEVDLFGDGNLGATGATGGIVTNDQLTQLLDFYNNDYIPRCGYRLGGGQVATTATNPTENVNSPNLVSGPNDPFLVSLLSCSQKRGLNTNPATAGNYQDLQTYCGPLCN